MWPPTTPSTELALSRRVVLRGAASAGGLLPLANLLPALADADVSLDQLRTSGLFDRRDGRRV